jgi:hypothetical protein
MRKKKESTQITLTHLPPKQQIYFFIGEKYYRRMQPTPYAYQKINSKYIAKNLFDN